MSVVWGKVMRETVTIKVDTDVRQGQHPWQKELEIGKCELCPGGFTEALWVLWIPLDCRTGEMKTAPSSSQVFVRSVTAS